LYSNGRYNNQSKKGDQPDPLKPSTLYYQGYSIVLNPDYKTKKIKNLKIKKEDTDTMEVTAVVVLKLDNLLIIFKKLVNCPAYGRG
jgi:hypothetical protein